MPRIHSPAQHRLRIGRCSVPGQIYLLTTVTHHRRPVFAGTQLARLAARCIGDVRLWAPSRCLCWVLMPDHWHGLVELGDGAGLASVMQRFKGVLSRRVGQHIDLAGPLWMHGYHGHALRSEEDLREAADYIVTNPVRAGLVACSGDWPYWDAWFVEA